MKYKIIQRPNIVHENHDSFWLCGGSLCKMYYEYEMSQFSVIHYQYVYNDTYSTYFKTLETR